MGHGLAGEVPVRRILLGHPLEKAVNPDSMSNTESLSFFIGEKRDLNEMMPAQLCYTSLGNGMCSSRMISFCVSYTRSAMKPQNGSEFPLL